MSERTALRAAAAAALLAASVGTVLAADPATGEQIVREADRRQQTRTEFYEGKLTVVGASGKVREKEWRYWRLGHGGEAKTIIQFTTPAEVAGVGLLTYAHAKRDDEQWMWTPAIQRERRIAPQEKSTRFLGTDFTYEDLSERVIEDWTYELLGTEPCGEGDCWKIESIPASKGKSQYTKTRLWFRRSDYALMRMEMEIDGQVRRTMVLSGQRVIGGVVTAHEIAIADVAKGTRTELAVSDVAYDLSLDESLFTLRGLRETHPAPRRPAAEP